VNYSVGQKFLAMAGFYTNDHFLGDTTKDEKWLMLVGRPSLAASRWRARRPAPPRYFHTNSRQTYSIELKEIFTGENLVAAGFSLRLHRRDACATKKSRHRNLLI
jgi:hypothetical protein